MIGPDLGPARVPCISMWPDPIETRKLLEDAAGDDPEALGRLLARHREPLRRVINHRLDRALGRRVDASDVVQGVLLEASRRLADYLRGPAIPFHHWLRRIARDHIIDARRRHRTAGRRSLDRERPLGTSPTDDASSTSPEAILPDQGLTPAAAAIRGELEARFRAALETLGAEDRAVLTLRHVEQLSNAEVAHALGLSEPAAGMRHLRALRRLRAALGERPSEDRP